MVATTAIFAEILIIGLETTVWIGLWVAAIFGTSWIRTDYLRGWEVVMGVGVVAAAYVLGILTDRVADTALYLLNRRWPGRPVDKPAGISTMRLTILNSSGAIASFLEYQRSRLRIARSTVLNVALTGVALIFAARLLQAGRAAQMLLALVVTAAATYVAYWIFREIEFAYLDRLGDAYRLIETMPGAEVAAAVPYKVSTDGKLQFILVTTRDGSMWTFPKGHMRPDETLPEAARREAREEGGLAGKVDGSRLGDFLSTKGGEGDEELVVAYALKVKHQNAPRPATDQGRRVRQFDPDEACTRLRDRREPKYANAMVNVLRMTQRRFRYQAE